MKRPENRSAPFASSVSGPRFVVRDTPLGATFAVKVHPRARKNAVSGVVGDALKLALTAPPVEGKANQAVIEFLAELLAVPRSSITIAAGQTSRNKVIRVAGRTAAQVEERLRAAGA
jgi:uncharacterized protein (TIGR00251 family)